MPVDPESRESPSSGNQVISNSAISGFHRLDVEARRAELVKQGHLTADQTRVFSDTGGLTVEQADLMAENVLGVLSLPLSLCTNLRVDGEDRLVPMVTEESSVVAAASFAAKLIRAGGGVVTEVTDRHMIGQIQLLDVPDSAAAEAAVLSARSELLEMANSQNPPLIAVGGGAIGVEVYHLPPLEGEDDPIGAMLIVRLVVDVRDAMGANAINTMCEYIAPRIAELTGGRVGLRILSNLADRCMVTASGRVPFSALEGTGEMSGQEMAQRIVEASLFAERDPYRAATHNKGIMNGVDAVLIAFLQDFRAVESGAHAYAARSGRYSALTRWRIRDDALHGVLEMPMAVGVVGGVSKVHAMARISRIISRITRAHELASITAAVGLAQNLGALRALAGEGIQRGHMRLHARNVAVEAGAVGDELERVAQMISANNTVNLPQARIALAEIRASHGVTAAPARERQMNVAERFDQLGQIYTPRILRLLETVMEEETPAGSSLTMMARYHLQTGGKRLRALLPLMVAEVFEKDASALLPFGAACEMLHNATLVHDDLQDGDVTRRGQETVWARFGAYSAIDLGDAMFYYTLLLSQRLAVPLAARDRVTTFLLRTTMRVFDGQEREQQLRTQRSPSLRDYFRMVEGKTSGLFALPIVGAAMLCDAGQSLIPGLEEASRHLGVLFQIQDDVLDLFGDKGRDYSGGDIREGKRSALVVHVFENAPQEQANWLRTVLDKPREEVTDADVEQAIALFESSGALDFTLAEMERRHQAALDALSGLDAPALSALISGMCDLFLRPIKPLFEAHADSLP